jgi:hypothetical protein
VGQERKQEGKEEERREDGIITAALQRTRVHTNGFDENYILFSNI